MWLWIKDSIAMLLLLVIIAIASFFISLRAPPAQAQNYSTVELVEVVQVIDGDTFEMKSGERVRLWGYDAPELAQSFGLQAKRELTDLLLTRETFCGRMSYRSHDRAVMRCWAGAAMIDIGAFMVRKGLGRDIEEYSGGAYHQQMVLALDECKGIWARYCT